MARPKKGVLVKKHILIPVRLKQSEAECVRAMASLLKISAAKYIRALVAKQLAVPDEEDITENVALYSVGTLRKRQAKVIN